MGKFNKFQHSNTIKTNRFSFTADVNNIIHSIDERLEDYASSVKNNKDLSLDVYKNIYTEGLKGSLYSKAKSNLGVIMSTCLVKAGETLKESNIKYYLPIYCFDIDVDLEKDKKYTKEELDKIREQVEEIKQFFVAHPSVSSVHTSASKLGLTGLIKFGDEAIEITSVEQKNNIKKDHIQKILTFNYELLNRDDKKLLKLVNKYGFHFDKSVTDLTRRRYITRDSGLYFNQNAIAYDNINYDLRVLSNSNDIIDVNDIEEEVKTTNKNTNTNKTKVKSKTRTRSKKNVTLHDELGELSKVDKKMIELIEKDFHLEGNTVLCKDSYPANSYKKGSITRLGNDLMFKVFAQNHLKGYECQGVYFAKDVFQKNNLNLDQFIKDNLSNDCKLEDDFTKPTETVDEPTPLVNPISRYIVLGEGSIDSYDGYQKIYLRGDKYITENIRNIMTVEAVLKGCNSVSLESDTGTGKSRLMAHLNTSERMLVASPVTSIQIEQAKSLTEHNPYGYEYKVFNSKLKNINDAYTSTHSLCCHASILRILEENKKKGQLKDITLIIDEFHALLTTLESSELDELRKFIFEHNIKVLYISATTNDSFFPFFDIQKRLIFDNKNIKTEDITFYVENFEGKEKHNKRDVKLAFLKDYLRKFSTKDNTIFVAVENKEEMVFLHDNIDKNYTKLIFNADVDEDEKEDIIEEITSENINCQIVFHTSVIEAGNNIIKNDTRLLVLTPLGGYHKHTFNTKHFNLIRNTQLKGRLRKSPHIDYYIDYELNPISYNKSFSQYKKEAYYESLKDIDTNNITIGLKHSLNQFLAKVNNNDYAYSETQLLKSHIDNVHLSYSLEKVAELWNAKILKTNDLIVEKIKVGKSKDSELMLLLKQYAITNLNVLETWGNQRHKLNGELQDAILQKSKRGLEYKQDAMITSSNPVYQFLENNSESLHRVKTRKAFKRIVDNMKVLNKNRDYYNKNEKKYLLKDDFYFALLNKKKSRFIKGMSEEERLEVGKENNKIDLVNHRLLNLRVMLERKKFIKDQTQYNLTYRMASSDGKKDFLSKIEKKLATDLKNFEADIEKYKKKKRSDYSKFKNKDLIKYYTVRFGKFNFQDFLHTLNFCFNIEYVGEDLFQEYEDQEDQEVQEIEKVKTGQVFRLFSLKKISNNTLFYDDMNDKS